MKKIVFTRTAAASLRKHANRADGILAKIRQYADDPATLRNNVTVLVGRDGKRLRVGDFRVLFNETADSIIVEDVGPRGGIYG
jgi:mRNA interferase RelE/StbE